MYHFPIVVNTDFTFEENEMLKVLMHELIQTLEPFSLDLSHLERIVVSQYFEKELELLSLFRSERKPITYTKNDHAVAVAKAIVLVDENMNFYHVLLLSETFINILFNDIKSALHLLHHELLHIHEFHLTDSAIPSYNRRQLTALENHYLSPVVTAWDEYYANRMATPTITQKFIDMHIQTFLSYLTNTDTNVNEKRLMYQLGHIGLEDFYYNYFQTYVHGTYLAAAYVIGYCHGLDKTLEEFSPEIWNILCIHPFFDTYEEMRSILGKMLKEHPMEWTNDTYNPLIDNILGFYKKLGVSLDKVPNDDARVWINVFFPE